MTSSPLRFPGGDEVRIVLPVLAREVTVVEAARKAKVPERSVVNRKRQSLEVGRLAPAVGRWEPGGAKYAADGRPEGAARSAP
jgi:hypothetical protein